MLSLMRLATACTPGAATACSETVIGQCGCPIFVGSASSQETLAYLAAIEAANQANCTGICPTQPDPENPDCGEPPTGANCEVQTGSADGLCVAMF